jgi:hypothetical protein
VITFEEARAPAPVAEPVADEPDPEPVELPDPEPLRLVEQPPPEPVEPAPPAEPEPEPAEPEPDVPLPGEPAPAARSTVRVVAWGALMAISVFLAVFSLALTIYAIAGGGF